MNALRLVNFHCPAPRSGPEVGDHAALTAARQLQRWRRRALRLPESAHHAILTACYAAGLRISEAVRLTVSAIDSERMVLRIEKGKGQKDRYVIVAKLMRVSRP